MGSYFPLSAVYVIASSAKQSVKGIATFLATTGCRFHRACLPEGRAKGIRFHKIV